MNDKSGKFSIFLLAAILGFGSMQLPHPYSNLGIAFLIIGFVVLIVIGHKAAFRAHPRGLLGAQTEPGKVLGSKLSEGEQRVLIGSIILVASALVSLALKLQLGTS